jgi:Na+-transporting NADH:ubiquinone oxidoreductase subunit NqrC
MSFLAEVLSEDVDKDADNFVQFELVDVAGETYFVGDEQLFFLGVTKKKPDQRKHIIDFNWMYN